MELHKELGENGIDNTYIPREESHFDFYHP